ncbi:MAG: DNA ligase [Burkholderiales bacterium]|nr:DNA ligase [Burkholderiales bacterium]
MRLTRRRLFAFAAAAAAAPLASFAPAALAASAGRTARVGPPLELARQAPDGIDPAGYLVSEKLDGVRALWDGRRLVFRSGLPIVAPQWFVSRLPAQPLDGELWLGRGRFEEGAGTVRHAVALDAPWRALRYMVFDLPGAEGAFAQRAARLAELCRAQRFDALQAVAQRTLVDRAALARWFDEVVRGGGEGLVLHRADALWRPGRSEAVLKLKPVADAEALVVAHVAGRGRLEGRLGALQVRTPEGVEFLLGSGLTDTQRADPPAVGSVVTYRYRSVTASGVPRFASFVRVRDPARS